MRCEKSTNSTAFVYDPFSKHRRRESWCVTAWSSPNTTVVPTTRDVSWLGPPNATAASKQRRSLTQSTATGCVGPTKRPGPALATMPNADLPA